MQIHLLVSAISSKLLLALTLSLLPLLHSTAACRSPRSWIDRTIYQVVTDRFSPDNGTGGTGSCLGATSGTRGDSSPAAAANLTAYCGGTFRGIEIHLDYIMGMGFDAIWISPVTANAPQGYHGYWPVDLYAINSHFSTAGSADLAAKDLQSLVEAAHARGMWVMVDVVPNHMGGPTLPPVRFERDYGQFRPFDQAIDYHQVCGTGLCQDRGSGCDCCTLQAAYDVTGECQDANPGSVEKCRVSTGLLDLDHDGNPSVASRLVAWLQWVTERFDFDGLRVDSAKAMPISFLRQLSAATSCYAVGEVFTGGGPLASDPCYFSKYQQQSAIDGVLSYPLAFTLRDVFGSESRPMSALGSTVAQYNAGGFTNQDLLGVFLDNHDLDRFSLLNPDPQALKSALVYVLLSRGIPIMYYGTEQAMSGTVTDGQNRAPLWHTRAFEDFDSATGTGLYAFISHVIGIRKRYQVWKYPQKESCSILRLYAFTRGPLLVVLTNNNQAAVESFSGQSHGYAPGQRVCNLLGGTRDCQVVKPDGTLIVKITGREQKIFAPMLS